MKETCKLKAVFRPGGMQKGKAGLCQEEKLQVLVLGYNRKNTVELGSPEKKGRRLTLI